MLAGEPLLSIIKIVSELGLEFCSPHLHTCIPNDIVDSVISITLSCKKLCVINLGSMMV